MPLSSRSNSLNKTKVSSSSIKDIQTFLNYTVPDEEAQVCTHNFEKMSREGTVDIDTKFMYAWCLTFSKNKDDIEKSASLFEDIFKEGPEVIKRESLFYLAVARTKLKHYITAKRYIDAFLSIEPNNFQAEQLCAYIKANVKKDSLKGIALIGSAAVIGGAAAIAVGAIAVGAAVTFGFKFLARR